MLETQYYGIEEQGKRMVGTDCSADGYDVWQMARHTDYAIVFAAQDHDALIDSRQEMYNVWDKLKYVHVCEHKYKYTKDCITFKL